MSLAFQVGVMSLPEPNSKIVCKYIQTDFNGIGSGNHDFVSYFYCNFTI